MAFKRVVSTFAERNLSGSANYILPRENQATGKRERRIILFLFGSTLGSPFALRACHVSRSYLPLRTMSQASRLAVTQAI